MKARNTSGKFAAKSDVPRKVRSVNLTDSAWQWLAQTAEQAGISRNDYLEALAESNPIMETAKSDSFKTAEQPQTGASPIMETVNHALTTKEEALADAAIFGFTPEEALADAYFQINMLQANFDELEDKYDALNRKYSVVSPIMETDALIISKNQEIAELKEQLAAKNQIIAEADEQIERLESELATTPTVTPIAIELPDPIEMTNKLNALLTGKNRRLAVKDVAKILNE